MDMRMSEPFVDNRENNPKYRLPNILALTHILYSINALFWVSLDAWQKGCLEAISDCRNYNCTGSINNSYDHHTWYLFPAVVILFGGAVWGPRTAYKAGYFGIAPKMINKKSWCESLSTTDKVKYAVKSLVVFSSCFIHFYAPLWTEATQNTAYDSCYGEDHSAFSIALYAGQTLIDLLPVVSAVFMITAALKGHLDYKNEFADSENDVHQELMPVTLDSPASGEPYPVDELLPNRFGSLNPNM